MTSLKDAPKLGAAVYSDPGGRAVGVAPSSLSEGVMPEVSLAVSLLFTSQVKNGSFEEE